jgi:RHS repeat-associated protein
MILRFVAAAGAWLTLTFSTVGLAQGQRKVVDENGIDLMTGDLSLSETDLRIGPADGGLSLQRTVGDVEQIAHNWLVMISEGDGSGGTSLTVAAGGSSKGFHYNGAGWVDPDGTGETLTVNVNNPNENAVFIDRNGVKFVFDYVYPYYYGRNIEYPNGYKVGLHWKQQRFCSDDQYDNNGELLEPGQCIWYKRLSSVTDNKGYQIKFSYETNGPANPQDAHINTQGSWSRLTSAKGLNMAVETCAPEVDNCTPTNAWPTVTYSRTVDNGAPVLEVADPGGRTWRYKQPIYEYVPITYNSGKYIDRFLMKRPDSASYTYELRRVRGVKQPGDHDLTVSSSGKEDHYDFTTAAPPASGVSRGVTTKTSASGAVTTIEVDSWAAPYSNGAPMGGFYRLKKTTDALGNSWTYEFNHSTGRVTELIAPEGNREVYTYNSRGNVTSVTRKAKPGSSLADIVVATADFDAACSNRAKCNRPNWTRDGQGNQTDYIYDAVTGTLNQVWLPAGANGVRPRVLNSYNWQQAWYRNPAGTLAASGQPILLLTATSACNNVHACIATSDETQTLFSYGGSGVPNNLSVVQQTVNSGTGPTPMAIAYGIDRFGNLESVDGPLAGAADTTRFRYDSGRRAIGTVGPDPDGGGARLPLATRNSYNASGRLTKTESGTVIDHSDAAWAAMSVAETTDVEYDPIGRKVKEILSAGGSAHALTQFSYDDDHRLTCTAVRMNPAAYGALPASACTAGTPGSHGPDRIVNNVYDANSRVVKVQTAFGTAAQGDEVTTTFKPNGKVASVTDGMGNKTSYAYDGHDRLAQTFFPVLAQGSGTSSATDYEQLSYDANGNVAKRRLRDGQEINFIYDNLNRVLTKDLPGAEPDAAYAHDLMGRVTSIAQGGQTIGLTYDALGQVTSAFGPLGTTTYLYDGAGRRSRMTWADGFYVTYDYDVLGNMTAIRENGAASGAGVLATFGYDSQGRRTLLTRGNGTTTTYTYDAPSRPTQLSEDLPGIVHDQTLGFSWNPAGQIATESRSNDLYAWTGHYNISRSYASNGLNQYTASGAIVPTYDARGNLTSAGATTYAYGAENMLLSASSGAALAYDPMLRLYQTSGGSAGTTRFIYDGADLIAEHDGANILQRRYVHGPGEDEPLVWYEGAGTTDRRWLHADARGSIVAASTGAGTMLAVNRYDEHGIPAATNTGRFQYTGQAWLPELGMYHYKARIYSPTLGRFLQPDPIGYDDGLNMYAYAGADPVNGTDPTGTQIVVTGTRLRNGPSANLRAFSSNTNAHWDWTDNRDHDMEKARQDGGEALKVVLRNPLDSANSDEEEFEEGEQFACFWGAARARCAAAVAGAILMINARIAARQLGLKIATNITLSGGRSGQLVKSLVGPPNSVIRGNGRVFFTNGKGQVVRDITYDRAKAVRPGFGFVGGKAPPSNKELRILDGLLGP